MADYRVYIRRSAGGFDGATLDTATYTAQGHKFITASNAQTGLFGPGAGTTSLGRSGPTASLIKVFSDAPFQAGDTVRILASNGTVRQTEDFTPSGSAWMYADPDDQVSITSAASDLAEIVVNDLSDDQLTSFSSAEAIAAAGAFSFAGTPVQSAANLSPSATDLSEKITVIEMTGAAAQDLLLPSIAAVAVGSQVIVFNSSINAHTITPTGLDEIDGVNAAVASAAGSKVLLVSGGSLIGGGR